MHKMIHRKALLRCLIFGALSAVLMLTLGISLIKNNENDTSAADGTVPIYHCSDDTSQCRAYYYAASGDLLYSRYIYVTLPEGGTVYAFCVEPAAYPMPEPGNYAYELVTNESLADKKIKILLYIWRYYDSVAIAKQARNEVLESDSNNEGYIYSWIHVLTGGINGSVEPLNAGWADWFDRASAKLGDYINNNADIWMLAKDFPLYRTKNTVQSIMWLGKKANNVGSINVQKCDLSTESCSAPQGNASFAGITFEVRNNSGKRIYNPTNDTFYDDGAVVATGTTDADGHVSFSGLPADDVNYKVIETVTNTSYELTASEQTVTLSSSGQSETLSFYDNPVLGKIKVNKIDSETGSCQVTSKGGSFAGTVFEVINKSTNSVKYDGRMIAKNSVITTKTFSENDCSFTINNLPYGTYQIKETEAASGYMLSNPVTVTIPTSHSVNIETTIANSPTFELGTTAYDGDDEDKYVNADEEAKIIDRIEYCARVNKEYTIKGILMDKETEEPFLVNGETVENLVTITPQETCGEVDMEFVFDASGLGGHELVVFESLYEGDELIISHEDMEDEGQTIETVYMHTTATDSDTDKKILPVGEDVTIKDVVEYCLIPGVEYTLKGVVMDKNTGNGLLVNSGSVESEVKFTPEERCGSVEMYFSLNTDGLSGKKLVVFESLYRGEELINEHKDLDDIDQSIDIEVTPPNTGAFRKENSSMMSSETMIPVVILSVVALGGYFFTRRSSKSKVMKF